MAYRKKKKENHHKMKTVRSPPMDRISNLPSNLIESILMLLPLRDAARTSILSRKWRDNWVKLPQLVFDDTLIQDSMKTQDSLQSKLFMTIYQVLFLHKGPILKFTLSISELENCPEIYQLIVFLSRNGIEELTLDICKGDSFMLPPSFYSCPQLKQLSLSYCRFEPPPTFNGFSRLVSLEFYEVDFADGVLGSLVSSCPLLEQLTLEGSIHIDYLEIDAPNLNFLSINAIFGFIHFKNTPLLAVVSITSIHADELDFEHVEEGEASGMIEVFGCLPVIETLELGYRFVKFLTVASVPERLLFTLDHLKILQLYAICFGEIAEVSFALCLIKSSPNLKKIEIELFVSKDDATGLPVLEFLKMQDYSDVSLNQLREVKMRFISGTRPELEFIKLILEKSPLLEKMIIESNSAKVADNGVGILRELTRFRRVSPKAEIIYKDADENHV